MDRSAFTAPEACITWAFSSYKSESEEEGGEGGRTESRQRGEGRAGRREVVSRAVHITAVIDHMERSVLAVRSRVALLPPFTQHVQLTLSATRHSARYFLRTLSLACSNFKERWMRCLKGLASTTFSSAEPRSLENMASWR